MKVAFNARQGQQVPTAAMTTSSSNIPALLRDEEAATRLLVSPATMRSWRCRGIGPAYSKLGPGRRAPVRYSVADLEAFIAEGRHIPPVRAAVEK